MCLLTYLPPQTQPIAEELLCGAVHNDDGHGYAIVTADNRLIVHKGLVYEKVIESFVRERHAYPEGPAMFHSRFATDGEVSVDMCHPFNVSGDHRTVVGHNGVLPLAVRPRKGDPRSDTAILAASMGQRFGSMARKRNRDALGAWITPYNKLVILTTSRRHQASAYIINEDQGIWTTDGIWYSNGGYRPSVTRYAGLSHYTYGYGSESTEDWDRWYSTKETTEIGRPRILATDAEKLARAPIHCPGCDKFLTGKSIRWGTCMECSFCLDCYQGPDECLCFVTEDWAKKMREDVSTVDIGTDRAAVLDGLASVEGDTSY